MISTKIIIFTQRLNLEGDIQIEIDTKREEKDDIYDY